MKKVNFLFGCASMALLISCGSTKPATKSKENWVPYSQALEQNVNVKKGDKTKFQYAISPGFDMDKEVDSSWSKPVAGKMVIAHKEGTDHISARPLTRVTYKNQTVVDGIVKLKMDLGPLIERSGKVITTNSFFYFTPGIDEDGTYRLDMPDGGIIKFGKNVYRISFPDEVPQLYINASMLEIPGDTLYFKGSRVK